MKKDIQISDELKDVFDKLKTPINIVSITPVDGVSTVIVDTIRVFDNLSTVYDLKDGMIVTIGTKNYQVSNVTHTVLVDSFTVAAINVSGSTYNVAANFQSGSRAEINQILIEERTDDNKFKRWPLVWYIYNDDRDEDNQAIDFESTINLAFAYKIDDKLNTNKLNTDKAIENSIAPIIQPLLTLFKLWIQSSDFIYMLEFNGHGRALNASSKNFPFYGITDSKKNVLESASNAIEYEITLKFKKQYDY
jgi:hypothetical protein